ncbi:MAG: polysaccharide deacetylase family protein [Bacteroidota bacterium]|nr:polysaccharide deacetylase family protein [Bacteroidota bacterium]
MVPLLITMDLEIARDHNINEQKTILEIINSDFKQIGLPLTIFLTSDSIDRFNESILKYDSGLNEFGIHGLNHGIDENYKLLSEEIIRSNIDYSYNKIIHCLNRKAETFRGPFNSTSSITQKVLFEKGFRSDFSVCSQRIDFMNSKGGDIRWLISPRVPYHPSEKSVYIRGHSPLWVVPLSCLGFPFISSMLYIFGLKFMKMFFRILLKESLATNKPIVYLFHSYEFAGDVKLEDSKRFNLNNSFLHKFYISDVKKRYELNIRLLKYMLSFDIIKPLNSLQYINYLERSTN